MNPATNHWPPYEPTQAAPWTLRRVLHLHRRAGFAATWTELQRDLAEGPKAAIDRIINGKVRTDGVPADFEKVAEALADGAVNSGNPERLKAWWVYRMLFSPDPLGERLTLMWHNHFAASNLKVNDLNAVWHQNQALRQQARAPFADLLNQAVREPALLSYLDAPANRKGHPNENLARELMELFTLGVGNYSETDVKEAARALTGWTVSDGRFAEAASRHDDGEKTVLGKTGRWRGDDLVKMLMEHPATATRLAFRICNLLMGEGNTSANHLSALASGLRENNLSIQWGLETVLRSQAFFDDGLIGKRVLSPPEFVVGAIRALEMLDPPPSTLVLAEWLGRLGQDLFYPPNVGGWPGGRSWITTRSLVGRSNFAAALVEGGSLGRVMPFDALGLAHRHGRGPNLADAVAFYCELFFGTPPSSKRQQELCAATTHGKSDGDVARRAVSLILASAEAQLA